ncbi:MAG TPA: phenylalanine--tRNA ligase subunit beta [Terriglobia bacterium]|nr:phenylalanine--tRNA ligase subunit beta [Terriglobia bacterium]
MKVSFSWLKEFVEVPVGARELARDLTMVGLNVESLVQAENEWILDIEVTTNRPDCLSHYGVAREVATLYQKSLKKLEFFVKESAAPASAEISVEIVTPELCSRYCGRVIHNVEVKPSPEWLVRRLEAVGLRSINNVADATNYVLMELGHPLHAFDLDRLGGRKIIVRRAKPGELLRTLDGVNRTLTAENLVIADDARPVALAGVMGGEESGISSHTHSVLLESAWFEPVSIRRTAKAHGMHTEASHRFERGADIEMAPTALDRVALLIAQVAGGQILRGMVDVYPEPKPRADLLLRRSEILRILGAEISWEEVERVLRSLGFRVERRTTVGWRVTPPYFRLDVTREVDLIEEVARHYGYDRLPARVRPAPPRVERDSLRDKELAISAALGGLGYHEIIASSMVDPGENARFTELPPVVLQNPLSQDASALRSTPLPSMIAALRWNLDRDRADLRLYERGKTYTIGTQGQPEERRTLSLGLSGRRHPVNVHEPQKETRVGFPDLKGDLETLFDLFQIPQLRFEPGGPKHYEPHLAGRFVAGETPLADFGHLRSAIAQAFKLRQPAWMAEVDLQKLLTFPLRQHTFRPYSRFPAVERDFSLIVPDSVTFSRIEAALSSLGLAELQDFLPVDRFRGGSIPAGKFSLLLRVRFQSPTHTLTSEEINEAGNKLVSALEPLGISLRA